MPVMDGLAATQALRAAHPEPRVVMHTAAGSEVRGKVAVAGAHALVPKGIRPDELLGCVRALAVGCRVPPVLPVGPAAPGGQDFLPDFFPPFLPSSLWAAELVRGFFFPSFFDLAFAFFAVALPLPLFSATQTLLVEGRPSGSGRPGRCLYPGWSSPNPASRPAPMFGRCRPRRWGWAPALDGEKVITREPPAPPVAGGSSHQHRG